MTSTSFRSLAIFAWLTCPRTSYSPKKNREIVKNRVNLLRQGCIQPIPTLKERPAKNREYNYNVPATWPYAFTEDFASYEKNTLLMIHGDDAEFKKWYEECWSNEIGYKQAAPGLPRREPVHWWIQE
ncbi:MAG: hypothetical protein Q9169_007720 [Polycauliona sp. 2 TL-2023]